jgi:hypothetical protein
MGGNINAQYNEIINGNISVSLSEDWGADLICGNIIQNSMGDAVSIVCKGGANNIQVTNNTVYNPSLNAFSIYDSTSYAEPVVEIVNNIVSECGGYGFLVSDFDSILIDYNNTWNCTSGNYLGVTPGVGSISADPQFVDPENGDLNLQRISPCIDAGDPASPLDPDNTRADMGALYFHQDMPVKLTLIPENPPIVIPETGGEFGFNIEVTNRTEEMQSFDFWSEIELPGWGSVEIMSFTGLSIAVGDTVDRDRTQTVPDFAPAGEYTYLAYVGTYPWIVEDYYYFYFEKEGSGEAGMLGSPSDWLCTGQGFETWKCDPEEAKPTEFALFGAYPNPFNATTTLSYALPEASHVSMKVYDSQGRLLARLVNGTRSAGHHTLTFDALELPSGIYFLRLKCGNYTAVEKLVLTK